MHIIESQMDALTDEENYLIALETSIFLYKKFYSCTTVCFNHSSTFLTLQEKFNWKSDKTFMIIVLIRDVSNNRYIFGNRFDRILKYSLYIRYKYFEYIKKINNQYFKRSVNILIWIPNNYQIKSYIQKP